MDFSIRKMFCLAFAAVIIPCSLSAVEAGENLKSSSVMSFDMMMFLLDNGISEKEVDMLLEAEMSDDDILFFYGLTGMDLGSGRIKGVSGMDLGSGRIKGLTGMDLGSGR